MKSVETKEAAKLIRKTLKRNFPGIKFSVRTNSYSMGSHVSIEWTDGPTERAVDAVVAPFYGVGFNSMDDSTFYTSTTMSNDDGTVEEVRFSGSRPSCCRNISDAVALELGAELAVVASSAVYVVKGEDREYTAEEMVVGYSLYLPVHVENLHFDDHERYFAVNSDEENAAACLIRQLHAKKSYSAA